ncbi:MAG: DUF1858 domain-containing protein [Candidatus Thorarchaeota archaeon]
MTEKKITKDMSITEVVMKYPETVGTFMEYGLHCIGCVAARYENIEQGAYVHGIPVDDLIEALNKTVND